MNTRIQISFLSASYLIAHGIHLFSAGLPDADRQQSFATSSRRLAQLDAQLSIPDAEYAALFDLYNATDGSRWNWDATRGSEWNFTSHSDPCLDHWQGVMCEYNDTQAYIKTINLTNYNLVGTMPASLSFLTSLRNLGLRSNSLSGSIPASLGQIASLTKLELSFNDLTGQVPSSFSNCSVVEVLVFNHNQLSGTLPPEFGSLQYLQVLDFYVNFMHGPIPETYSQLSTLQFFDLYENAFSGTIPEFLGNLTDFEFLYLGNNSFTGTFPSVLGDLPKLQALYVNKNSLTGTVPRTLAALSNLVNLCVENNQFHGSMAGVTNPAVQHQLSILLFSGNQFTGSIPPELFQLDSLTVLDGSSNCMSGSLPSTLCNANSLITLILDGVHTSTSCRALLLPGLTRTYALTDPITGGIPTCLFELPQLTTLHLSGNGLTGSLPDNIMLRPTFVDFSMSHNFLDGTIPQQFQLHAWHSIDWSHNRLQGTLHSDFAPQASNASLKLRNNRLSGTLPGAVLVANEVDVLEGNLFSCNAAETDLPMHDPNAHTYQCGSNSFNVSYYFWLCATTLMLAYGIVYALRRKDVQISVYTALYSALDSVRAVISVFELTDAEGNSFKAQLRRYHKICDICKLLLRIACLLTAFILLVLMPFYGIIGVYYDTHTFTYAYRLSLIFLSGEVPMGVSLLLLSLFALFAFACFVVFLRQYQRDCVAYETHISVSIDRSVSNESHRDSASHAERALTWEKFSIYMGCVLIDVIVVVGANSGFIWVVLNGNDTSLSLAQVALSLFKIFWSSVCSWTAYHLAVIVDFESKNIRKGILSMLFLITLFNNIVAPCLVVMVISATCFYNVFENSASVTTEYLYEECYTYDQSGCTSSFMTPGRSTFSPPFIYSYQCAASFLTAYAPSFVYLCIVSGFFTPLLRWAGQTALRSCTKGSRWYKRLYSITPMILRPISTSKSIPRKLFSPYFDSRKLLVTLLNYLGILMTFGAVFPPLAVAMCLTIISHIYFTRLEVKNFLEEAARKNTSFIDVLDEDCLGVGSDTMLLRAIWVLITLSFWFYTLFLFDTLGDAVGLGGAFWVLVVVPALPAVLYGVFKYYTGTWFFGTKVRGLSTRFNKADLIAKIQAEATKMQADTMSPMPHFEDHDGNL